MKDVKYVRTRNEPMMDSDGSEHDRYSGIYIQLENGLDFCTDEDED